MRLSTDRSISRDSPKLIDSSDSRPLGKSRFELSLAFVLRIVQTDQETVKVSLRLASLDLWLNPSLRCLSFLYETKTHNRRQKPRASVDILGLLIEARIHPPAAISGNEAF